MSDAFVKAHLATRRSAVAASDRAGIDAIGAYRAGLHLSDPALVALCTDAVTTSLGGRFSATDAFPAMVWYGGATVTAGGVRFKGTFGDFVEHVLVARSREVAAKRKGWVVTPTSNSDGRRLNASTTAVHALNLDCDGRGSWDALLGRLRSLGVAHAVYQSGGWTAETPKWHALIPLTEPYDTSNPDKIEAWKKDYEKARVCFGALAGLTGEGFDPRVETPCVPVFVTERRRAEDPARQVVWAEGRALDLHALCRALPALPDPEKSRGEVREHADLEALEDEKLREIVDALAPVTSEVPGSRRDLYLSLSGALLDRGLLADDMIAIVEQVSARYPRRDSDKHRDNVHSAQTTAKRWESGAPVTQIGTLNDLWPDVAKALDRVLPNVIEKGMAEALPFFQGSAGVGRLPAIPDLPAIPEDARDIHSALKDAIDALSLPQTPKPRAAVEPKTDLPSRRIRGPLARRVAEVSRIAKKQSDATVALTGYMLDRVLGGVALVQAGDPESLVGLGLDEVAQTVARHLGRRLPPVVTWSDVLELMAPSIQAADRRGFLQSVERVRDVEDAFDEGREARIKGKAKMVERDERVGAWARDKIRQA